MDDDFGDRRWTDDYFGDRRWMDDDLGDGVCRRLRRMICDVNRSEAEWMRVRSCVLQYGVCSWMSMGGFERKQRKKKNVNTYINI